MNYLAHFFLSGTANPLFTLGNFLGDFVKGKKYNDYPAEIRQGILFHREVDTFTDGHPLVLQSKKRLFPRYHHYSAVLVDLYYDHLLAVNFMNYSRQRLSSFAAEVYAVLEEQREWLPEKAKLMAPYMIRDNWLVNYGTLEGLGMACAGIARRTRFPSGLETGPEELQLHYSAFQDEFRLFFPDIQQHMQEWLNTND